VRLGEALSEEELEKSTPIIKPVMPVPPLPSVECHSLIVERVKAVLSRRLVGHLKVRCDQHQSRNPVRVFRGQDQFLPAVAPRHQDRSLDSGPIENRHRISHDDAPIVGAHVEWTIRPPVAPGVESHHGAVTREVWNLALPCSRVNDFPRRKQQKRGVALSVDLVEDTHAIALYATLVTGIARTCLLTSIHEGAG
jgi:hypothetical protein